MPTLHLTKVAFGCRTLESLQKRIAARSHGGEVRVTTRMRPKRMEELVGGSLHWIVKHRIIGRQLILRIEDRPDGRIDIVCSDELIVVPAVPKRAHQGWRYLESEVSDEADPSGVADLPPRLYGKLAALSLV